ncbi:MAG: hypothetical protein KF852_11180 [Saprospiraceae bacterium]|nr:hypothetical protein [Saprospiraceae bacterium]
MKTLLICVIALMGAVCVSAQSAADKEAARKATEELTAAYSLSEEQAQKMYVIQERRFRNLSEVESLKTTDEALYFQKLKSIRLGTEASIERMLSPEQLPILQREKVERRKLAGNRIIELEQNGASKAEIQRALDELEEEY